MKQMSIFIVFQTIFLSFAFRIVSFFALPSPLSSVFSLTLSLPLFLFSVPIQNMFFLLKLGQWRFEREVSRMEKEVEKRDRIRELQTGKENGGREGERGRDKKREK